MSDKKDWPWNATPDIPRASSDWPVFIYIYDANGRYGEPVQINTPAQMQGPGTKLMLRVAREQKVEIRITNTEDELLYHEADGKVMFDGLKERK